MKKILLNSLIIFCFITNHLLADIKNYTCKKVLNYWNIQGEYTTTLSDEVGSLIFTSTNEYDEWGSNKFGEASFIFRGDKINFHINDRLSLGGFTGYSYTRIDQNDISLNNRLKKYKDRLEEITFLRLEVSLNNDYYELFISKTSNLDSLETDRNRATIFVDRFTCN